MEYALEKSPSSIRPQGTMYPAYACDKKHIYSFSAAGRTDFRFWRMVNQENIVISNF